MNDIHQNKPQELEKKAKELYQARKYQLAADKFAQAADLYQEGNDHTLTAEMRNNQSVSLLQAGDFEAALEAVQGTAEIFSQAGEPLKRGMALANEATAYQELGLKDKALDKFSQAAVVIAEVGNDEMLMQIYQSISSLKLKSRNIPGALFAMQEGLKGLEKPNFRQRALLNLLKIPNKWLGD